MHGIVSNICRQKCKQKLLPNWIKCTTWKVLKMETSAVESFETQSSAYLHRDRYIDTHGLEAAPLDESQQEQVQLPYTKSPW